MDKVNEMIDDMYRIASKKKYRFEVMMGSFPGTLTVEGLWDLKINKLKDLALKLHNKCESYKEKSNSNLPDNESDMELKFCIVMDILRNRMKEEYNICVPNEEEILNIEISKN